MYFGSQAQVWPHHPQDGVSEQAAQYQHFKTLANSRSPCYKESAFAPAAAVASQVPQVHSLQQLPAWPLFYVGAGHCWQLLQP